jgi:hypothetical protein
VLLAVSWKEKVMPLLADVVDAVVGIDTHRDLHVAELAGPTGAPLASVQVANTSAGYNDLLGWIARYAPGPPVVVAIEGTRSFGIGVARALSAAGLPVIECEQPARKARRGHGKSDPIDAHLAVLTALRLDADRLPTPRADGAREALRILLSTRQELTATATAQTNRLRALLLTGPDQDRDLSRATFTDTALSAMIRRRLPADASVEQAVRHAEIRRLSVALRQAARALKGKPTPAPPAGRPDRAGPHRPTRPRPDLRRPGDRQLLPPRPPPQRSRVCGTGRNQPVTGQQRTHRPTPTQPGRGPRPQPRRAHHRADPHAQLRTHPHLRRPTNRRWQDSPRDPPHPQALHHP